MKGKFAEMVFDAIKSLPVVSPFAIQPGIPLSPALSGTLVPPINQGSATSYDPGTIFKNTIFQQRAASTPELSITRGFVTRNGGTMAAVAGIIASMTYICSTASSIENVLLKCSVALLGALGIKFATAFVSDGDGSNEGESKVGKASAGELYARHNRYALNIARSLTSKVGSSWSFERAEVEDAALEGLLDACRLWEPSKSNGATFETFAFWYIKGRAIDRLRELRRTTATSDYAFEDERDSASHRRSRLSIAHESYLERMIVAMDDSARVMEIINSLRGRGMLSPVEEAIAASIFIDNLVIDEVADELGIPSSKVRVAAAKLLQKIRVAQRDRCVFEDDLFLIPAEDLPAFSDEAVKIAAEALGLLKSQDGAQTRAKPLLTFQRFLPDLAHLTETVGAGESLNNRKTDTAKVISIYKYALGLRNADLADALDMNVEATNGLMVSGKLESKRSFGRILELANSLSIDPEQILFRAVPGLAEYFDRVVYAGDDVYLAFVDVSIPPEEMAACMASAPEDGKAHSFSDVIKAYRISHGVSAVRDLGGDFTNVEMAKTSCSEKADAMASKVGMPPLLMLLGTNPELFALFDVVDANGNVIFKSGRDYGRMVIVLNHRPRPDRETSEPAEPGFGPFMQYLVARRGPVFTSQALERHGLTQRMLTGAIGGVPPQYKFLKAFAEFLKLSPIHKARLVIESIRERGDAENPALLAKIIEEAVRKRAEEAMLEEGGWNEMLDLTDAEPGSLDMTIDDFLDHLAAHSETAPSRKVVSDRVATLIAAIAELWNIQVSDEHAAAIDEGFSLLGMRKYVQAREKFLAALGRGTTDGRAKEGLRLCNEGLTAQVAARKSKDLRAGGMYEEARVIVDEALRRVPGSENLLNELGKIYEGLRDTEGAEKAYKLAVEHNPERTAAMVNLGRLATRLGDFTAARRWFEVALGLNPNDEYVQNGLGYLCLAEKKFDEAYYWFSTCLNHNPGSKNARAGLESAMRGYAEPKVKPKPRKEDGLKALRDGDFAKAKEILRGVVEDGAARGDAFVLVKLADAERKTSDVASAKAHLTEAYKIAPADVFVLTALAKLAKYEGNVDAAKTWLIMAREVDKKNQFVLNFLGELAMKDEREMRGSDFTEAKRWFEEALEAKPGNANAMNNLGKIAFLENDLETAKSWHEQSLGVNPEDVHALTGMGKVHSKLNMSEEAEAFFSRALNGGYHAPALFGWFKLAAATGDTNSLMWQIEQLRGKNLSPRDRRELDIWQTRVANLNSILSRGVDPDYYVRRVAADTGRGR